MAVKPKARVRVVDRGLEAFLRTIPRLDRKAAKVGIQGNEASEKRGDDLTMVELGEIHEFGKGVPERSFLRATADENENKYRRQLEKALKKFLRSPSSFSLEGTLFLVGERMRGDVIRKMRNRIDPPLAPSTVANRARRREDGVTDDVPLIDFGLLLNSITAIVKDRE